MTATQALVPHDAWAAVEAGLDLPDDYFKKARDAVKTLVRGARSHEPVGRRRVPQSRAREGGGEGVHQRLGERPRGKRERARRHRAAVRELGEFTENGSRSRLSPEARESVLAKLYDAREALPPAPPSLADRLLGL